MNKINISWSIAIVLVLAAISTRFLPHPPNFTAIGAMALFGGAHFSKKSWAIGIPFAALLLSDVILNKFIYQIDFSLYSLCSYLSFGLIFMAGKSILTKVSAKNVLLGSVSASLIFFLVTNAFSWLSNPMYSKDFAGLISSYTMGVPFFWNTLAGDLVYSTIMFGIYAMATAREKVFAKA